MPCFSASHATVLASGLLLSAPLVHAQSGPRPTAFAAARFLGQASWGPTPESIAHVQQAGFGTYIDEEFALAPSTIPDGTPDAMGRRPIAPMQQMFFYNAVSGSDQLRQRVAWGLGQIWVVSGIKLNDAAQILPFWRLLQQDAFTSYRQIMYDVTLSPAMGHYLDMVNNDKPNPQRGTGANENYARELLQLFTIGLSELNPDGTYKLDTSGQRIPTYDQNVIEGFANTFTGWTYASQPGVTTHGHNPANFAAPMVAYEPNHDTGAKTLLRGRILPKNQTASVDLDQALANVLEHPNVGPFICRQLIQHLVTSAPSGEYVRRVASVFANNGNGVRGDMRAVVKAILLDPAAREGDTGLAAADEGHLREPVLFITALLRALGATVMTTNALPQASSNMGQNPFYPATVFNYYPPNYEIGNTGINAPEFGIYSPATAMLRLDFLNSLFFNRSISGVTIDLTAWTQAAADPNKLLDAVSARLLGGALPASTRSPILAAVKAAATPAAKVQTALYLTAGSNIYSVEQ